MTAIPGSHTRDLLPRWRPFGLSVRTGELASLRGPGPQAQLPGVAVDLGEAAASFMAAPGPHTAGDLLGRAALVGPGALGHPEVRAALEFVERGRGEGELVAIARFLRAGDGGDSSLLAPAPFDKEGMRHRAAALRRVVSTEPRNAIRWADLALAHVNLGALDAAKREMQTAVALSTDNRYVLRAAARFYMLLGEQDRAHRLFTVDPAVIGDPWLHATELAVAQSAGRSSRFVRRARDVVDQRLFAPWHVSELAGELATAELRAGNARQARKYMRAALLDPTENTVAQAEWAAVRHGTQPPEESALSAPLSFEARARLHLQDERYADAATEAELWHNDQPFALEPAVFSSYVTSVGTQEFDRAILAARQGLVANPDSAVLRNNLAFALANRGDLSDAAEELRKAGVVADPHEYAVLTATRGLVAFRLGNHEEGRALYRDAVELLRARRENDHAALAALMLAREEVLAGTDQASAAYQAAEAAAGRSTSKDVRLWRDRLQRLAHPAGRRRS